VTLDKLAGGVSRAAAALPDEVAEAHITFAGRPARVRAVGAALADAILAPFLPLATAPSPTPQLTLDVWDGEATGVPCPIPVPGEPRLDHDGDAVLVHTHHWGGVSALDRVTGRLVGWRSATARMTPDELTKPEHLLLAIWLSDRGVGVAHTALVAQDGRGALIAGDQGAGKSTAALACAAAGMAFLGDDRCGIEETADGFTGHALSLSARLDADHIERHPWLTAGHPARAFAGVKSLLHMTQGPASVPIRVLLLPERGEAALLPVSGGRALFAIAPSSLIVAPGGGHAGFDRLARLAQSVPAFRLRTQDPAEIAPLVAEALDRAAAPAAPLR
jgi:hypothetical protein